MLGKCFGKKKMRAALRLTAVAGLCVCHFTRMIRAVFVGKITLGKSLKKERVSNMGNWGETIPGGENSGCKGPKEATCPS